MMLEVVTFQHPDEFPSDVRQLFDHCEVHSTALGSSWYRNYVETVSASNGAALFHVLRRDNIAIAAIAVTMAAMPAVRHMM